MSADLMTMTRAQYERDIAGAKAAALREVAESMATAEPSATLAPGWRTAEVALRVRADDIEAGR